MTQEEKELNTCINQSRSSNTNHFYFLVMKKRVIFPVLAFVMAAGSVFATSMFVPETGYSNIQDVPDQGMQCVDRKLCDTEGQQTCTIELIVEGESKIVPLYRLEIDNTCDTNQLFERP